MNSSSPSRKTSVRKPSHLGSKIHPSPGGNSPTRVASIGRTGGFTGRSIVHSELRSPNSFRGRFALIQLRHSTDHSIVEELEPLGPRRLIVLRAQSNPHWLNFRPNLEDRTGEEVIEESDSRELPFQEKTHVLKEDAHHHKRDVVFRVIPRSEERRVGKECRSRWSP